MKTALIYGEFLPDSSTGIAYVNSTLDSSLNKVGYKVTRIIEPRTKDYSKSLNKIIKKSIYLQRKSPANYRAFSLSETFNYYLQSYRSVQV